jgi:hypothetical protein
MSTLFGSRDEASVDEVRVARIAAARRCEAWREIDGPLIRRGPRFLNWWVHAESDRIFRPYAAAAFATASASIVADRAELVFTVEGDTLTLFERVASPTTWSEHVARQARRRAAS